MRGVTGSRWSGVAASLDATIISFCVVKESVGSAKLSNLWTQEMADR